MAGCTACDVWKVGCSGISSESWQLLTKAINLTGFKLGKETAFSVLDKWRRIRHPNIVSVREAFTTRLFNDSCTYTVH